MSSVKLTEEQALMAAKLTPLQRKTVIGVVSGKSQRQAYLDAGGTAKTESAQDNSASIILSNAKVRAFYESLMQSAASEAVLTREEALTILTNNAKITMADVADFKLVTVGEDESGDPIQQTVWTIKNSEDIDPNVMAAIKSIKMTNNGPQLELHDQHQAIKQITDMQGWNAPKKSEVTGKDGAPLAIDSEVKAPEIAAALAGLMEKL